MPLDGREISLDLCKKCEFVWFDGGELEALPKAEDPHEDLSPEMRQQLAIWKVQQETEIQDAMDSDSERLQGWVYTTEAVLRLLLRFVFKV